MKIACYRVTVKHDHGTVEISVGASSKVAAVKQVMRIEKCPLQAILIVKQIGGKR